MVDEVHTTAKVNGPLYKGVMWAGLGVGVCFVVLRIWVRKKTMKKFFSDDYLVILAIVCFLISAALQETQLGHMYELFAAAAGEIIPSPAWMEGQTQLLHDLIGFNVLFYTGLWAIKLSFLLFFRRLAGGATGHRCWWWIVLVITASSWVVCIADMQWECMAYSVVKDFERYMQCGTPDKVNFQQTTFKVNCALDVGSDILILTIPIALLWNRRIPLKKKIALIGLFCVTILIMLIAILRVTLVSTKGIPSDMTWLYFWSNVEVVVALIVSSLASFRQLYVNTKGKPLGPPKSHFFGNGSLTSIFQRLLSRGSGSSKSKSDMSKGEAWNQSPQKECGDSTELIAVPGRNHSTSSTL